MRCCEPEPSDTPLCQSRQFLFFLVASGYGLGAASCAVFFVSALPPVASTQTLLVTSSTGCSFCLFGYGVSHACCCDSSDCSLWQPPEPPVIHSSMQDERQPLLGSSPRPS